MSSAITDTGTPPPLVTPMCGEPAPFSWAGIDPLYLDCRLPEGHEGYHEARVKW